MKLRDIIAISILALPFSCAFGQDNTPFMVVDNDTVTKSYFDYLYNKSLSSSDSKISREEYISLFTNFRLKVAEAKAQGLDTTKVYKRDVGSYRDKVVEPYLFDTTALNSLARLECQRSFEDINVSHILVKIAEPMSPKDTLLAYNKAETAKRLLKNDVFDSVAVWMSDDPSVGRNFGHLGWTTAMQNVIDFENAMYNAKKGDIVGPVRTGFGYHVIKINDRRASQGELLVAHIMKAKNDSVPALNEVARQGINDVYARLQNGETFESLLSESDDKQSAENGGQLPWFGMGKMIDQIESAAFALKKVGDYSKPVETPFGWHILKLVDKRGLGNYESRSNEIKSFIMRSDRASIVVHENALKLKKEYGYSVDSKLLQKLNKTAAKVGYNDSLFRVKTKAQSNLPVATFSFGGKKENYTLANLISFIDRKNYTCAQLEDVLEAATDDTVAHINKKNIELLRPEIKNIVKEYEDGILLFEVSNREVWAKASQDTLGQRLTFEANRDKYAWKEPRWRGRVVLCKDAATEKKVNKILSKETDDEAIDNELRALNKNGTVVRSERGLYSKGSNKYVNAVRWGEKLTLPNGFKKVISKGEDVLAPASYKEVRGQVIQDYQEKLEKEWVEKLKNKHKVTLFE
ncbi:MAG: peptidylprolyl isomerase [Paludibacteraceae bacterium]|nr:peptidylprolyl isomerase [Paludibacteraceae bacterium]